MFAFFNQKVVLSRCAHSGVPGAPLSRYSVEWQPDDKHLLRVGNPRLYDHLYQRPQLPLWEPGEVEWFVIIRTEPKSHRRRKKGRIVLIQPPL